jgi:hypothetical protein
MTVSETDRFRHLLREDGVPWSHLVGARSRGPRIVRVPDLLRWAHEVGLEVDEQALDALVSELGGRREQRIHDLPGIPRNLLRKLAGRPAERLPPVYVLPPTHV